MLRRLLNNKTSTTTTTSVCNIRRRLRAKAYYFTMATTTNTTTTTITKDYDSALKLLETLIVTKPKEERAPDVRQVCNVTAMNDYLKRLNLKISELRMIHVAGTKGKGSTCAMCESILRTTGLNTGLYTSPHMFDVRERIRINGVPISKALFNKHFWECWEKLETTKNEFFPSMATYFRFLTLIAFKVFLEQKVDVAIFEVGVGGRLDATNVITPLVSGITSIAYDHVDLLGDTLAKIASEKAGIIKPNVPCFTYAQDEEAMQVFREKAQQVGAPLYIAPSLAQYHSHFNIKFDIAIAGQVQRQNAALALALCAYFLKSPQFHIVQKPVLEMLPMDTFEQQVPVAPVYEVPYTFLKGLAWVRWPCRSQLVAFNDKNLLFFIDGAHTTESLKACCQTFLVNSMDANANSKYWKFAPTIKASDYDLVSEDEESKEVSDMVSAAATVPVSPLQPFIKANAVTRIALFYYTGNRNPEDLIEPLAMEPFDLLVLVPSDSQHTVLKNKNITTKDNILIEDKTGAKEKQKLEAVKALWQTKSTVPVMLADSIQHVLNMIWQQSSQCKEHEQIHVLVTGSFYLAGDMLRKLIKLYKALKLA